MKFNLINKTVFSQKLSLHQVDSFQLSNFPGRCASLLREFAPPDWFSQTKCHPIEGEFFNLAAYVRHTKIITGDNRLTQFGFFVFCRRYQNERIDWYETISLFYWELHLNFMVFLLISTDYGYVQNFPPFTVFPYNVLARKRSLFFCCYSILRWDSFVQTCIASLSTLRKRCLNNFTQSAVDARRYGDYNAKSSVIAEMMKLLASSFYGF